MLSLLLLYNNFNLKNIPIIEILFLVEDDPDGGYKVSALGQSIFTQADDMEILRVMIRDAVQCHFTGEEKSPKIIIMSNNMNLKDIKKKLFTIIKFISIPLITSAIGLEIWNIQIVTTNNQLPSILTPALIIAHIALSAHFVEGIIVAFYAPSQNQHPLKYGTYTFFVGTVGLLELWENRDH